MSDSARTDLPAAEVVGPLSLNAGFPSLPMYATPTLTASIVRPFRFPIGIIQSQGAALTTLTPATMAPLPAWTVFWQKAEFVSLTLVLVPAAPMLTMACNFYATWCPTGSNPANFAAMEAHPLAQTFMFGGPHLQGRQVEYDCPISDGGMQAVFKDTVTRNYIPNLMYACSVSNTFVAAMPAVVGPPAFPLVPAVNANIDMIRMYFKMSVRVSGVLP